MKPGLAAPKGYHDGPIRRMFLRSNPRLKREGASPDITCATCSPLDWPVIIAFLIIGLYFYGVQFSRGRSPGFCFFGTSRTPDKFLRPANDMVRRFPPVRRAGWREAPCICRGFFFWLCR